MCALTKRPSEDKPVLQQYGHSVLQQQLKSSNTIVLMHFSIDTFNESMPFLEKFGTLLTHHHPFPFHVFSYFSSYIYLLWCPQQT